MTKKQEQGMETKKRIVDCACALFRERGFHDVTVDDIIRAANSSKGGFYNHFQSKEELLFYMVPMVDALYLDFAKKSSEYTNTIQKITAFAQYVFNIMENEIGLDFISTIYAFQIDNLKTERFLTSTDRTYYSVFERLIDEGKEKGDITKEADTSHTVKLFTSVIRGVIYDWCLHKGEFDLAAYGAEVVEIMLNNIKRTQRRGQLK